MEVWKKLIELESESVIFMQKRKKNCFDLPIAT